jgi:hypothetical protein
MDRPSYSGLRLALVDRLAVGVERVMELRRRVGGVDNGPFKKSIAHAAPRIVILLHKTRL